MSNNLFNEGGPHRIKSLGNSQYEMTVGLPTDEDGRVARECTDSRCSPGYFKITPGTGITGGQTIAYCPYCRTSAAPNDFATQEQARFAKDVAVQEAQRGIQGMLSDVLGLGPSDTRKIGGDFLSMEMSFKPGQLPPVQRPFEDEVRRDVICPHCTLDQTVFGLATWCADCGRDIFLVHVAAELEVTRRMIGDVPRRIELLGKRTAAKDLENCLEDMVSLFEAAMKAMVQRALIDRGHSADEAQALLRRCGNAFQSVERTRQELLRLFEKDFLVDSAWRDLGATFEKRHPITHNLGVVDRKYLERTTAAEPHGREVRVTTSEIRDLLATVENLVGTLFREIVPRSPSAES